VPISTYHDVAKYKRLKEAFRAVLGSILLDFALFGRGNRDLVARNFVARTETTLGSIVTLHELRAYQDCWILHRCLLDRLFHLQDLLEEDSFDRFEAWSFLQQYGALERLRSDPEFGAEAQGPEFDVSAEQRERAVQLRKRPPVWRRPKAADVARRMGIQFLYRFGYDFASTHVHPMANDGLRDFHTITGLESTVRFPDERVAVSNTFLVASILVQTALNASTLRWHQSLYDFLEQSRTFLGTGDESYASTCSYIGKRVLAGEHLAQTSTTSDG
jgi:hypothetical protein